MAAAISGMMMHPGHGNGDKGGGGGDGCFTVILVIVALIFGIIGITVLVTN